MPIRRIDDKYIDITEIYFIQAGDGPIFIGCSKSKEQAIIHMQPFCWTDLRCIESREGNGDLLASIHTALSGHRIRGQWFAPSPEVLAVARGDIHVAETHAGGRRLTEAKALEVFRMVHETGLSYRTIGEFHGITRLSVGKIARGQAYPHLFKREDVPPGGWRMNGALRVSTDGEYLISENRLGTPKYRITEGKRMQR